MSRCFVTSGALLALFLVICADASGMRQLRAAQPAPAGAPSAETAAAEAPGPATSAPPADILFTLSAPRAILTSDSLSLAGVSPVVQSFTSMSESGVYSTADFANSSAGARFVSASGEWLGQPVAVLKATAGSQTVSALVALSKPHYDASTHTLTFKAKVLPATPATGLPTSGGAAERLITDSANGLASTALASAPAGDTLTNVGLFIDQNSQMVGRTASTKYGGGYGYGHGGGYYRGGGGYHRGGEGYYRGGRGYYRGGYEG